jgi:ABC-type Fe3+/spermidine/putrescine transport system ATPase subunit
MHVELREIQRAADITFVLVTHDQEEAMSLADRIAVMARCRVLQVDAPRRLYEAPASREVATFISNVNLIETVCVAREGACLTLEAPGLGRLAAVADAAPWPHAGATVTLALRPEKLRLGDGPEAGLNAVAGRVGAEVYAGDRSHARVVVRSLAAPLLVTLPNTDRRLTVAAAAGEAVTVIWRPEAGVLLPGDGAPGLFSAAGPVR